MGSVGLTAATQDESPRELKKYLYIHMCRETPGLHSDQLSENGGRIKVGQRLQYLLETPLVFLMCG